MMNERRYEPNNGSMVLPAWRSSYDNASGASRIRGSVNMYRGNMPRKQ